MPRRLCFLAALCLLAASVPLSVVATSAAVAKNKSSVAAKHKSAVAVKKHKSAAVKKNKVVAAKKKQKSSVAKKKRKSSIAAKEEPVVIPQPRTPVDKHDCIAVAQAFYERAGTLSRRTKQTIPKEFISVISKLDEFCGEEEFEKARVSINWMNTCLQNFTDQKAMFCVRNESYFCASADPKADGCLQNQ
jgi:hypothetical protein